MATVFEDNCPFAHCPTESWLLRKAATGSDLVFSHVAKAGKSLISRGENAVRVSIQPHFAGWLEFHDSGRGGTMAEPLFLSTVMLLIKKLKIPACAAT